MNGENLVKVSAHTTHGPCHFEAEVQKSIIRLKEAVSASLRNPKAPDKSAYWKTIFFISHPKHMLLVLKRTVSMRRFF